MLKIRWTTPAAQDLESIFSYLQENHPGRARSTVVEIRNSVQSLKQFPYRSRRGSEEGTRELPHSRLPYILVYRVNEAAIEILHIWHGAQDWRARTKIYRQALYEGLLTDWSRERIQQNQ